jgi:hydroxyacylglutathione hydrolase
MPDLKAVIVPVTPFQQNCSVFWDDGTRRGTVIDPGGDVARILGAIDQARVTVDRILLTHGHIDHAGGAAELKAALEARVAGTSVPIEGPDPRDRFLLDGIEAQARSYGIAGVRNVSPDRWLAEGDTVEIAGATFAALHCPGHTPGHLVFVSTELRFAVVGDVLFAGSVGRTDFPYGDPAALVRSIREKLFPLGDDIGFVPGHGQTSTFGWERKTNPYVADLNFED